MEIALPRKTENLGFRHLPEFVLNFVANSLEAVVMEDVPQHAGLLEHTLYFVF